MKNIRIPTLLATGFLILSLGMVVVLVESGINFFAQANPGKTPQHIMVVNITDASFNVSWTTQTPTRGAIQYRENHPLSSSQVAYDIRDTSRVITPRFTHFVAVTGLKPQTQYDVSLVVEHKQVMKNLTTTTGMVLKPPQLAIDPAFGTLYTPANQPVSEALVFASFTGSQTLGTLVDPDGTWVVPLGYLRTQDGSAYFIPTKQDTESISFITHTDAADIKTNITNDSPLPDVILGKKYDFTSQSVPNIPRPVIAQTATQDQKLTQDVNGVFSVLLPKPNSALTSGKPAFKGEGVAGKKVIISIMGDTAPLTGKTTVTDKGTWNWTPPTLAPKEYIATIVSFTQNDESVAKTVAFTILKSGTSVLQAATPSATLTPSPLASPRVSPIASVPASPSASPPPVTGTWEPTLALLFIGIGTIILGIGINVNHH